MQGLHGLQADDYADIIDLPYSGSLTHRRMAPEKRAAQFSPFAALTGYDEAVDETARLTQEQAALGDGIEITQLPEEI
ncbi:MAG: hypothetical protein IKO80_02435 [Lachnospiraceae bacterium]|nr:hypothetical protein [Lachnospiraceae bacterium]